MVGLYAYLRNADLSVYQSQIEGLVARSIGHELDVSGRFELRFGATTVLVAENATLTLSAAQADDWSRVATLEAGRRERLSLCFSKPVQPANSELFAEALAVMLHMNEELMQLLQSAREAAAVQNSDQMRTQKSIKHYLDIDSER